MFCQTKIRGREKKVVTIVFFIMANFSCQVDPCSATAASQTLLIVSGKIK